MNSIAIKVAALGIFALASVGSVGHAAAAPLGGAPAADVVNQLESQGYDVQINGSVDAPLSTCRTTDVHGVPNTSANGLPEIAPQSTTVYVDVNCPTSDD